jgi:hypothetical protein
VARNTVPKTKSGSIALDSAAAGAAPTVELADVAPKASEAGVVLVASPEVGLLSFHDPSAQSATKTHSHNGWVARQSRRVVRRVDWSAALSSSGASTGAGDLVATAGSFDLETAATAGDRFARTASKCAYASSP